MAGMARVRPSKADVVIILVVVLATVLDLVVPPRSSPSSLFAAAASSASLRAPPPPLSPSPGVAFVVSGDRAAGRRRRCPPRGGDGGVGSGSGIGSGIAVVRRAGCGGLGPSLRGRRRGGGLMMTSTTTATTRESASLSSKSSTTMDLSRLGSEMILKDEQRNANGDGRTSTWSSTRSSSTSTSTAIDAAKGQEYLEEGSDEEDDDEDDPGASSSSSSFPRMLLALSSPPVSYPIPVARRVILHLARTGFADDDDVARFASAFVRGGREEVVSRVLIDDFGWGAMDAHVARVGMSALVTSTLLKTTTMTVTETTVTGAADDDGRRRRRPSSSATATVLAVARRDGGVAGVGPDDDPGEEGGGGGDEKGGRMTSSSSSTTVIERPPVPLWKSVHVNDGARMRRSKSNLGMSDRRGGGGGGGSTSPPPISASVGYNYGMSIDDVDRESYRNLHEELDEYMSYMTVQRSTTSSSRGGDDRGKVIREETARVYMTHARLFLGWVVDARGVLLPHDPSEEEEVRRLLDCGLMSPHDGEEAWGGGSGPGEGRGAEGVSLSSRASSSSSSPMNLPSSPMKSNVAGSVRKLVWKNVLRRTISSSSLPPPSLHAPSRSDEWVDRMRSLRRSLSLYDIFPNPSAESASSVLQYVLWLRSERGISQNYEANM